MVSEYRGMSKYGDTTAVLALFFDILSYFGIMVSEYGGVSKYGATMAVSALYFDIL